ncbi:MAG TPA: hypothetical protein VF701_11200 [Thermoanaerobaculia bacterium]
MKTLALLAGIAIAFFVARSMLVGSGDHSSSSVLSSITDVFDNSPEAKARKRFEEFMRSWKKGGTSLNDAEQAAACLWARGVTAIADLEDLKDAVDYFDRWRREKALYVPQIEYEITGYRRESDHTIADVTINGNPYQIRIPDSRNPMSWSGRE